MRKQIKAIRDRHKRAAKEFMIDEVPLMAAYLDIEQDDVTFVEWLRVHEDRSLLLDEIDRLYKLLRSKRKPAARRQEQTNT